MKTLNSLIITATTVLCLALSAQAGTITTAILADNEAQIINTGGTVVSAANLGSSSNGTLTVDINGISHAVASSSEGGDGANNLAELTINSSFDGHYRGGEAAVGYTGDLANLLGGIAGTNANGGAGPISLDISDLVIGTSYLFQGYWEANNFNQIASVTFEGTDTQGGIAGSGAVTKLGVLISYTFTATDTVLDADLTKTGGTNNIWWQGYSLQAVPVPAPAALPAGLALLGLAAARRRRIS